MVGLDGEARNHDAAGNTVSIGGREFVYNAANRMGAVKQGGVVVESYGYSHRGERVLRAPASGDPQLTLYDEAGRWIGNYSATGQPQQQAIWLDNQPIALINTPSASIPKLVYVQPDHLGTPRVMIDPMRDAAIWAWSSKSEVFGNQTPNAEYLDSKGDVVKSWDSLSSAARSAKPGAADPCKSVDVYPTSGPYKNNSIVPFL